jgi:hypothetical protein
MGTFYDMERAFQKKLKNITGAPFIQYEGMEDYQPGLTEKYWRTNHVPSVTIQVTAGALKQHVGIYRVEMIYPNSAGLKAIMQDQDLIAQEFDTVNSVVYGDTKIKIDGVTPGNVDRQENKLYSYLKIAYTCMST